TPLRSPLTIAPRSALPMLAVFVQVRDLAHGPALDRSELSLRISDRHQRVGLHFGRQPQYRLYLVFEIGVNRREHRAETQSAAGENDVLHGGIDARTWDPRHALHR